MGLLERLVGPDAARQFRERMLAAQAAQATPGVSGSPGSAPAANVRPGGGEPGARTARSVPAGAPAARTPVPVLADPLGLADLAGDFPTSILASPDVAAPPLLAAFANRPALLAAIVFSEALAPPVALR